MELSGENAAWPPRDFVGYGKEGIDPKWPGGAKICVSFCLNVEEGGENEVRLGDSYSESYLGEISGRTSKNARDPSIESEFEYGARAGVRRILRIFEDLKVKCTVWGVGKAIERNPDVALELVRAGHEVVDTVTDYSKIPLEKEAAHVGALVDGLTLATGGIAPVGHYVGRHSLNTLVLLAKAHKERGVPLLYSSDSYADDLPSWVPMPGGARHEGLLMIPYALDTNDCKFGLPNGFGSPDDFYSYLKAAFDYLYEEGKAGRPAMLSIGLHSRISGRPARASAVRRFVDHISGHPDVWVATRREIAEHWAEVHPYVPEQ